MKKKRSLLLCIVLSALAALCLTACSGQKSVEELIRENGATVMVTLDLAGGLSSGRAERYVYIEENAPVALPWEELGGKGIINPPVNGNLRLDGFYHGTKDEEGNITYGAKWERTERFSEDTTLYARWLPPFVFRVLAPDGTPIKDFAVSPGDKLDVSDRSAARIEGSTFIAYYEDSAFTRPWDPETVHPGYPEGVTAETATEADCAVTLYARYEKGDFKKVYTASDFSAGATDYWLIGDENGEIDFSGRTFPTLYRFGGRLVGNGVKIKNVTIERTETNIFDGDIGMFGTLDGAEIENVTFENCSVTISLTRRPKDVTVLRAGFLAGVATGTTLKKVTFIGCTLSVTVAVSATGDPVVPYESYEEGDSALWTSPADDGQNGNTLADVTGSVTAVFA